MDERVFDIRYQELMNTVEAMKKVADMQMICILFESLVRDVTADDEPDNAPRVEQEGILAGFGMAVVENLLEAMNVRGQA